MHFLKLLPVAAIFMLLSLPVFAQQHQQMNSSQSQKIEGIPKGWNVRFDHASADGSDVEFTVNNGVLHFNADAKGAAIYYKPEMRASGSFSVNGTFSQLEKTHHPEAYGLFIGGNNLQKDNQQYLYFLIHQGGKFLIKRRTGDHTETIVDWKASDAVHALGNASSVTNKLEIKRTNDAVTFWANGQQVKRIPASQLKYLDGIAGLRINHHLNVKVTGFKLDK